MKSWSSRTAQFLAAILVIAIAGPISQARATDTPITDPTYGTQGIATISVPKQPSASEVSEVLIDDDGNTIALVDINSWNGEQTTGEPKVAIARYLLNGSRDSAFGDGTGTSAPLALQGASIALQSDGKILLVGLDYTQTSVALVARRYLPTGKLDPSFATGGVYSLSSLPNRYFNGPALVAVDPATGRIILATGIDNGYGSSVNFYLVSLKKNGSSDYSLGNNFVREINLSDSGSSFPAIFSIEFLAGGALLVLGKVPSSTGTKVLLMKFGADGNLDTTFDGSNGGDGIIYTSLTDQPYIRMTAMTVLGDGRIAIAGMVSAGYGEAWFYALAVFTPDGVPDQSFNSTGFLITNLATTDQRDVNALVKKESGSFYFPVYSAGDVALISVNAAGTSSSVETYAPAGRAISVALQDQKLVIGGSLNSSHPTSVVIRATDVTASTVLIQENLYQDLELGLQITQLMPLSGGKILGLGSAISRSILGESSMPLLFRLNANGSVDASFGDDGFVLVNTADYGEIEPSGLAVQEDGKIVVVAEAFDNGSNVLLFRTTSTGVMDTTFGTQGFLEYDSGGNDWPSSLLIDNQQRILVVNNRSESSAELLRFSLLGERDQNFDATTHAIGVSSGVNRMKFDANQNIILVGGVSDGSRSPAFIARLSPNGQLDPTFSSDGVTNGYTLVDLNDEETSFSGLQDFVITDTGKIAAIGSSNTPHKKEAVVYFDQNGNLDTSRANPTGITRYESKSDVDYAYTTSIVEDGDGFLAVGGGAVDGFSQGTSFATILRFGSSGFLDTSFDEVGVHLPDTNGAGFFTTMSRINPHQSLAGGFVLVDGIQRGLVMRIGVIPSVETTTPTTVSPSSTVVTQATVPTTSTTVPVTVTTVPVVVTTVPVATTVPEVAMAAAQPMPLKLVISVSQATILKNMKLTVPKGGVATMSIAKSSAKVCKVVKKQVVGTAIGTCRVSVTIKMKTKKNVTKSMSFKVSG